MNKECKNCSNKFEIFEEDLELLKQLSYQVGEHKFKVPVPEMCPDCRAQNRLAWRNERKYFKAKSSLSGDSVFSVFHPDSKVKSISYDEWWSDAYNPLDYGRDFDFNKPFFEQFNDLLHSIPQMAVLGSQNENSNYCNLIANCKNCYLLVESSNCEDCYYSYWLQKCLNCIDSSFSHECQYCYEIDNCNNCYNLQFSKNCHSSSASFFLDSCTGCKNCFCCVNLNHKEYCIFNKQVTKEEYFKMLQGINFGSRTAIRKLKTKFEDFSKDFPKKYAQILKSENCTGNYIISSKDCYECYHADDAENCRYGEHVFRNAKDVMDVSTVGRDANFVYQTINTGISIYRVSFSIQCWNSSNLAYCYCCMNSKDSFGSVGLKNNKFCIFNKEYSESEYNNLVPKIVEHMKKTGEWGNFFPINNSIFPYNETSAQDNFPLTQDQAKSKGLVWREKDLKDYLEQEDKVPDSISNVNEEILSKILACVSCRKNYKIISQEFDFYNKHNLPIPEECADCRHSKRANSRQKAEVFERECTNCSKHITSPFKPGRPEKVFCEACFAQSLT